MTLLKGGFGYGLKFFFGEEKAGSELNLTITNVTIPVSSLFFVSANGIKFRFFPFKFRYIRGFGRFRGFVACNKWIFSVTLAPTIGRRGFLLPTHATLSEYKLHN